MCTGRLGAEEALEQLPSALHLLMNYERFNLHRPRILSGNDVCGFDVRYLPENSGAFSLPCFWIRRKHFYVHGKLVGSSVRLPVAQGERPEDLLLYPIHPVELGKYTAFLERVHAQDASRDVRLLAVPTSSTRTVLAWPDGRPESAAFLKLSLHSRIYGDRRITRQKLATGIGLSSVVAESLPRLPQGMGYLFEPAGFVPRLMPDSGVVVREVPEGLRNGDIAIAPLFSLIGGTAPYTPVLLSLAERTGHRLRDIICEVLCTGFAGLWVQLSARNGLLLEAHGQDLLLELSADLASIRRFCYRDFEGLTVDWALRDALGLHSSATLPLACSWYETYGTWGYPGYQQAFSKWKLSLFGYLALFLSDLEYQLRHWWSNGLIGGPNISEGELTGMFSAKLRQAIESEFGVTEHAGYDIYHSLDRFVLFLMKIRRDALFRHQVN